MNPLCSLSGARLRTTSAKWFPVNFRPCTELLWWLDLFMGLFFTTFTRPQFGRWVCDLHLLFVHVLDDEFVIGTISIRPWLRRMFLRLHPVLSFGRVYLGIYFSFWGKHMDNISLRPRNLSVHACLPLVDHSKWMHIKWRIPIQLCIYLKIHHIYIYIYLKIQTYANHSSRVMAHAWELVPLGNKNNTNSSKNSTKVRTLMYFLGDY